MATPRFSQLLPRAVLACGLAASMFATAAAAQTQDVQADPKPVLEQPQTPDFLFGRPRLSVGVRGGWIFARAGSDLYDFVTSQLTVDRQDFNAPAVAVDIGLVLTPRLDAIFGIEASQAKKGSEYRHLVDNNHRPIEQQTTLTGANLSGSIRFALLPRGRSISRLAWIPRGFIPYVGAGGGAIRYEFEQAGDFVDYVDSSIFTDYFFSTGWAPSAHVFGGVDVQLHRFLYGTFEARYLWGAARLGPDFIDFDPIDLAGFRVSAGISAVF